MKRFLGIIVSLALVTGMLFPLLEAINSPSGNYR